MNQPDPRDIRIQTYNYPLPDDRIARYPLPVRDHSRLLVYRHGDIAEAHFYDLPALLPADSLMVFNNTRVIRARLHFTRPSGALIEVFCLEPLSPPDYVLNFQQTAGVTWLCLIGNLKKWKEETLTRRLDVRGRAVTLTARRGALHGTSHAVTFGWDQPDLTFADILEAFGELPIPPYLHRATEASDAETYQTVYARPEGSVAAPTAGLHFTPDVLRAIDRRGIERAEVTLHVGAGTFRPVKSELIADHAMHTENFAVSLHTLRRLIAHHGQAIAVGTTSVRTLESLYYMGAALIDRPDLTEADLCVRQWQPYDAPADLPAVDALRALAHYMERHRLDTLHSGTQIIIAPGYRYRIVRAMVTNFHQPQSTLLLLVSAFVGERWRDIYDYALTHDFRFLSYGDSSLLIP